MGDKTHIIEMIEQMLENLSFAGLPAITGTIICGIGLTGLMLWIIKRGRTHMQGSDQIIQLYQQIDLFSHLAKNMSTHHLMSSYYCHLYQ